ncbi:MAG: hypothetical protein H6506_02770 [Calditrichaeota bacterium]|nr:hypothetical protein [Calditrichota bacterium]MCB9391557.1 hypothetical protein [Calditrichota bacterium]
MRLLLAVLCCAMQALAVQWISLLPQPGVARDLAMGGTTSAMFGSTSAVSQNPAGVVNFPSRQRIGLTGVINGTGPTQLERYFDQTAQSRATLQQVGDVSSMMVRSVSARFKWVGATAIFGEPVMHRGDQQRFTASAKDYALSEYQTGLIASLNLHKRVRVGGRVDFYTKDQAADGEGFSYGVILKPRGVQVGLHYQRYPATGERWLHPLDRRVDQGTTASLAIQKPDYSLAFQLMNLSQSDDLGFLEPRLGGEWRPVRAVALRGGGSLYSRSRRAVVTAGIGLLDANWLRHRADRLEVPEDVLSIGMALVYERGRLVQGFTAVTLAWRL